MIYLYLVVLFVIVLDLIEYVKFNKRLKKLAEIIKISSKIQIDSLEITAKCLIENSKITEENKKIREELDKVNEYLLEQAKDLDDNFELIATKIIENGKKRKI